jgi:uncharacterized protein (DUF433 family)
MAIAVRKVTLGRGVYGARHIASYVALAHGQLAGRRSGRWLREVLRPVGHVPRRFDYTFAELVSVLAVAELVEAGCALAAIASARERLVRLAGVEQPFALRGLFTDGSRIAAQLGEHELTDLATGAQVAAADASALTPLPLTGVTFASGVRIADRPALHWSPMPGVRLDPEIQLGYPCIEGSRLPTWTLQSLADDGSTAEELQSWYFLSSAEVEAALAFERRLAEAGS